LSYRLYLDIGNSALKHGVRQGGDWKLHGSLPYLPDPEQDDMIQDGASVVTELTHLLDDDGFLPGDCDGVVYCCCNPHVDRLLEALRKTFACGLRALGTDLEPVLKIGYHRPEELGADRLANATGAALHYGRPCVVVDAGTCITSEVISADGELMGGAIAAGRAAILAGLIITVPHLEEALLQTEVAELEVMLGRSTAEGLVVGVALQLAATADRLVAEALEILGEPDAPVVLTGGDAALIEPLMAEPVICDDKLALEGLRLSDGYE
jgi:type III pantothenate kinase